MPHLIAPRRQAVVRPPATAADPSAPRYVGHLPERTLLYGLVQAGDAGTYSCGARRMVESVRHLAEEVFGPRTARPWVLGFPYPLRFLFASKPEALGPVLGIVQHAISTWLADQVGVERHAARTGAVTLIQRFGSALNSVGAKRAAVATVQPQRNRK